MPWSRHYGGYRRHYHHYHGGFRRFGTDVKTLLPTTSYWNFQTKYCFDAFQEGRVVLAIIRLNGAQSPVHREPTLTPPQGVNVDATSHTTYFWDNITQFYTTYLVHSSKVWFDAIILPQVTEGNYPVPWAVGWYIDTNGSGLPLELQTYEQLCETGRFYHHVFPNNGPSDPRNSGGASAVWSAKKWFGVDNLLDNILLLGAATSTVPTGQCFAYLVATPVAPTITNQPISYRLYGSIGIEYNVSFHDPMSLLEPPTPGDETEPIDPPEEGADPTDGGGLTVEGDFDLTDYPDD